MKKGSISCWAALLLSMGCHWFGGTRIKEVATASGPPSNVATLLSVTRSDEPVAGLSTLSFRLTENGVAVDPEAADLRLLDPARIAAFHTVLLVDLSDSASEGRRHQLAKAVSVFVEKVRRSQSVSVMGFDGSPRARPLGDFAMDPKATGPLTLDAVQRALPSDPSRNLRGALVDAQRALQRRLRQPNKVVPLGTLVVFARGPDLAGRVDPDRLEELEDDETISTLLITVNGDPGDETTEQLAGGRPILAQNQDTLGIAFQEAARQVLSHTGQYYLLSYCSPSRAGERQLRVEVSVPEPEGKDSTDSFEVSFDSAGFRAGCDSNRLPRFTLVKRNQTTKPLPASPAEPSSAAESASESPPTETETSDSEGTEGGIVPPPNKPGYAQ